jgi:type IV secretory pathway VirB10-like protein
MGITKRGRGQPGLQYNIKGDADRGVTKFMVDPEVLEKIDEKDRGKYIQQARPQNPIFEDLNFNIPEQVQQPVPVQQPIQQPAPVAPAPPPPVPQQPDPRTSAKMGQRMAVAAMQQKAEEDQARKGKFARAMQRPEAGMGAIAQGMTERPRGRKFGRAERPSVSNMPQPRPSGKGVQRLPEGEPRPRFRSRKSR